MEEFDKLCEEGNFEDAYCWIRKRYKENDWADHLTIYYYEAYFGIERGGMIDFEHMVKFTDEVSTAEFVYAYMVDYCFMKEDFDRVKQYLKMGLQTAPRNHLTLKQAASLLIDCVKNKGTYQSPIYKRPSPPYEGPNAAALLAELDELIQGRLNNLPRPLMMDAHR